MLQKGLCASGGNQGSGNGGQTSGGSNDGAQAGKPAGDKAQGGKSANSLASTGDQTVATVAAIGGLGAAIAAIGVFLARFRRKEDWRERLTIAHVSQEGRGNRRGPHFTGAV